MLNKIIKTVKKHKSEVIFIGGAVALTAGTYILVKSSSKTLSNIVSEYPFGSGVSEDFFRVLPVPNKEMNTIDVFVGSGDSTRHLWVFDPVEANAFKIELEDALWILNKK